MAGATRSKDPKLTIPGDLMPPAAKVSKKTKTANPKKKKKVGSYVVNQYEGKNKKGETVVQDSAGKTLGSGLRTSCSKNKISLDPLVRIARSTIGPNEPKFLETSLKDLEKYSALLFSIILDMLKQNVCVGIPNFGTFSLKSRKWTNPETKEVSDKVRVHFKPSSTEQFNSSNFAKKSTSNAVQKMIETANNEVKDMKKEMRENKMKEEEAIEKAKMELKEKRDQERKAKKEARDQARKAKKMKKKKAEAKKKEKVKKEKRK